MNDGGVPEGSPARAEGGTLMLTRRRLLAASAALLFGAADAAAQDWPHRPVRVIVPFGPGGGATGSTTKRYLRPRASVAHQPSTVDEPLMGLPPGRASRRGLVWHTVC
jgi:hypothetical protein